MIDLNRIEAYCKRATEGPWFPKWDVSAFKGNPGTPVAFGYVRCGHYTIHVLTCTPESRGKNGADMEFIASSRQDLPAVVEELKAARAEIVRLKAGA